MPIEYESKLTYLPAIGPDIGSVDVERGEVLGDFFPGGDAEYFGVRFRVCGLGNVERAVLGQPSLAELTIKGPGGSDRARLEQTHTIDQVLVARMPACVKQRFRVTRLTVEGGSVPVPDEVIATLDIICTAYVRPVIELEGPAHLVDPLTSLLLASPGRFTLGGPRYRKIAQPLQLGQATRDRVIAHVRDQRRALRGEPVGEDHYPWLRSGPLPDYYG